MRVELWETLDELVSGIDALELRRDERFRVDGLIARRECGAERWDEARENGEFARDICAVQVVGGVGLLCRGERHAFVGEIRGMQRKGRTV